VLTVLRGHPRTTAPTADPAHTEAPSAARSAALARRFEAAIVDWDRTAAPHRSSTAERLRRTVEGLCALGFDIGVVSAADIDDVDGELRARPSGPGALHLCVNGGSELFEIGPSGPVFVERRAGAEPGLTPTADAVRWLLGRLWLRGIAPRGVVLACEPTLADVAGNAGSLVLEGPTGLLDLLTDQLERREQGELPPVADERGWTLQIDGVDPLLERAHESLLTLADGRIGTAGSPLVQHPAATGRVLAAGLYTGEGAETALLECPRWTELPGRLEDADEIRRILDLRGGVLHQRLRRAGRQSLDAVLFSSLERPGTAVLRAAGERRLLDAAAPLVLPTRRHVKLSRRGRHQVAEVAGSAGGLAVAASDRRRGGRLDRLAVYCPDARHRASAEAAYAGLLEAEGAGFEQLLVEQRCRWADRWHDADVVIEGDPSLQLAVRLALFHLMNSVADGGEAAVGARGLSGHGYRGHVFWDADVFVLPFLAATHPAAARAMLEYRLRRLPAARVAARELGLKGARFAWESAASGADVTPTQMRDRHGRVVPIRTGQLEEHIVADVAWAASCYLDWTGDAEFAAEGGRTLLVETARYWASRIRLDGKGRGHIYGVIGPDEYHEPVDDNAYTNVMARWNLRRAAALDGLEDGERERWLALAGALADGYDPERGLYEQFAGFFELEPLVVAELAMRRPVAADLLLGPERVAAAQVLKQADVLMLHHLVPDEVEPGSLVPNLSFYEPRTAHGSSLSPAVHAALFARAGMHAEALASLRLASRIDLEDLTGTTAGGLHLAAMGGVWQALAFGFAGVRPAGDRLALDPRLPPEWGGLELRLRFRGSRMRVRIERDALAVAAEPATLLDVAGLPEAVEALPTGIRLERRDDRWEVQR
jgi:trehalose/maltose hydrolase-like predicted phosphorylase